MVLAAFNTTAMVLGYIVLAFAIGFVCWILAVWHDKWKYQRRRNRRHDIEWDNLRSAWIFDTRSNRVETNDQEVVYSVDRIDTAVMEFPIIQGIAQQDVYDYMEELHRDVS